MFEHIQNWSRIIYVKWYKVECGSSKVCNRARINAQIKCDMTLFVEKPFNFHFDGIKRCPILWFFSDTDIFKLGFVCVAMSIGAICRGIWFMPIHRMVQIDYILSLFAIGQKTSSAKMKRLLNILIDEKCVSHSQSDVVIWRKKCLVAGQFE